MGTVRKLKKVFAIEIMLLFAAASGLPSIVGNSGRINEQFTMLSSPPWEQWNLTFGGSAYDYGRSVQLTTDGGYIITGETDSYGAGNGDAWLIKINATGQEQWIKTYGGANSDGASSAQQTSDGGYIIAGFTYSYGAGNENVWLIKTDQNGTGLWNRTFGGSGADWGNHVQQTSDGGYIIIGSKNGYASVWLIKIKPNGVEKWNKTFVTGVSNEGYYVQQTADSGYILVGKGNWLIKTDVDGEEQWNKTFTGMDIEQGHCVRQTSDGGFILCGFTSSNGTDVFLLKTDSSGNEQWNKTFGGAAEDRGYAVQRTSDGGYIVAGYTQSFGAGSSDVWLIRTDSQGNEQWNETFGGANEDAGYSVQQTTDDGYVIGGETESFGAGNRDAWLIKTVSETVPGTVYVDDDYNSYTPGWNYDHFNKIQSGINAVKENGTVYVFNGTYYENVNVLKNNLTIIGEDKNTTIIDGGVTGLGVIYINQHHFTKITGFSIRNGAQEGVYIRDAHDNEISNCTLYQCPEYGVAILGEIVHTTNNIVRDCDIYNNLIGGVSIWGYEYNYLVNNNVILRCDIHDNANYGVVFRTNKNTGTMRGNNITHCIIHNNSGTGIYLDLQGGTIYNCSIHGTLISNNSESGISMKNVYASVISACTISNNGNYGIQLITSSNNTVYHNNFIQNNQNAFDYSLNAWDNGYPSGGNYWDNYTGTDSNNDSIGDTPYNISGGSNQDHYPFMQPNGWFNQPPVIPTIVGPTIGLINENVTFCITATDPNEANLYSKWDWGDGNITEWLGPYSSGETVCASHIWPHNGTYDVKVKLKNENDHESSWSDPHVITIYELKKVLILGRYANMTTDGVYVTVQARNIWVILFNPSTQFTHYNSGEKLMFSKANSNVIFTPRFLIGLVNVLS